ncbi:MAG: type II toxin-antitoxin system Phd/YefM family antitoxin [Vulcanimicrobiota bacterium]
MQYNVHEAKTHLSRLLERAHQGEEIIIAKAGKPYVRLVPVQPEPKRELGWMSGQFSVGEEIFDPLPEDELRAWEGE